MKTLKVSEFNNIMTTKKVEMRFCNKSNVAVFGYDEKESDESEIIFHEVQSDTIKSIKFYVRVIFDVQLFNYNIIDIIVDKMAQTLKEFYSLDPDNSSNEDPNSNISFSGPVYKVGSGAKQITTWLNVDIPYIIDNLQNVNEYINKIVALYKEYCDKFEITGNDVFFVAKLLAKTTLYTEGEDSFTTLLIANYQQPNSYVPNVEINIMPPKDIVIFEKDNETNMGCRVAINNHNGEDKNWTTETIFDDKVRFLELSVQRLIQKEAKFIVTRLVSRSINISRKDRNKNKYLIKYDKGNITVAEIMVEVSEYQKSTCVLSEYISNFLKINTLLSARSIKNVIGMFGKSMVTKMNNVYGQCQI